MPESKVELNGQRVFVAGHKGMVGSAIVRRLSSESCHVLTADRKDLDLTRQEQVEAWFQLHKPDCVFLAAARVGGILANSTLPVDFLTENLLIELNVICSAAAVGVRRLLFLGSSCIYPKYSIQPICENELLNGSLEPTNEWYAIAKIAGIKLCQSYRKQHGFNYISVMPSNLYGPGDNYNLNNCHVLPALVRKFCEAVDRNDNHVTIWGSGTPLREFLYVDNCADGLMFLMKHYNDYEHINLGSGEEISIINLAKLISKATGFKGKIITKPTMPDGTPRKFLNSSKIRSMGWKPTIILEDGIRDTIEDFHRQYL